MDSVSMPEIIRKQKKFICGLEPKNIVAFLDACLENLSLDLKSINKSLTDNKQN